MDTLHIIETISHILFYLGTFIAGLSVPLLAWLALGRQDAAPPWNGQSADAMRDGAQALVRHAIRLIRGAGDEVTIGRIINVAMTIPDEESWKNPRLRGPSAVWYYWKHSFDSEGAPGIPRDVLEYFRHYATHSEATRHAIESAVIGVMTAWREHEEQEMEREREERGFE